MTALTGCSKDMANRDVYEESGNTINVNNKRHELYNEGGKPWSHGMSATIMALSATKKAR